MCTEDVPLKYANMQNKDNYTVSLEYVFFFISDTLCLRTVYVSVCELEALYS